MTRLRTALAAGAVHGVWSTLPGPATVALLAAAELDFIVFDLQHGALTEEGLIGCCAAADAAGLVPLARTRSAGFADVGRPLDLGAHGVIVPSIGGVVHAREVIAAVHYPPRGTRSNGRVYGGADDPLCVLMIETSAALAELEQIVCLPGVDAVFVGPFDLAISLGGREAIGGTQVARAIDHVVQVCTAAELPFGVFATDGGSGRRHRDRGARLVTLAADETLLAAGVRAQLAAAGL